MFKLKSNTRFLNIFDGKIYEKDDEFSTENKSDFDYLTSNKIATEVKEAKDKKAK